MTEYPAESQDSLDGQGSAGGHEAEGPRGASGTREVSSPVAGSPSATVVSATVVSATVVSATVSTAAALDDDFDFSDFEEPPPADVRGADASASEPSDESPETKRGEAVWPPSANAGGDVAPTDRPTVVPPFDIESYARSSLTSAPPVAPAAPSLSSIDPLLVDESPTTIPPRIPDAPGSQGGRPTMPTLTDEGEIERARLSMFDTSPPPERRAATTAPPRLPSGVLSLADARLPTPGAMPAVTATVSLDHEDDAPELEVRDSTIPQALQDPVVEMKDRFNLGDFTGAMSLAESILLREPANAEALRLAEECQRVLIKMYAAKIGPLDRVPTLNVQPQELRWLSIDHRAGFLLSLVDGTSTIEMILDLSGMPLLDTLRILNELHQQRIISFRS